MGRARRHFKGGFWRDALGRFVRQSSLVRKAKAREKEEAEERAKTGRVARRLPGSYTSPFRKYTEPIGKIHGRARVVAVVRWSPYGGYRGKDHARLTSVITLGQFTRNEARKLSLVDVKEAFRFEKKGTLEYAIAMVAVKPRSRRKGIMVAPHKGAKRRKKGRR